MKLPLLSVTPLGLSLAAAALLASFDPAGPARATHSLPCTDIDGSGRVAIADYYIAEPYLGQTVPPAPPQVDQDSDGTIELVDDLRPILSDFGKVKGCQDTPLTGLGPPTPATTQMYFPPPTGAGPCDDSVNPTRCVVEPGITIPLRVALSGAPPDDYIGLQARISYGTLTYKPSGVASFEVIWPDASEARRFPAFPTGVEGIVSYGALTGTTAPFPLSSFEGNVIELDINSCAAEGDGPFTFALPIATATEQLGAVLLTGAGDLVAPQTQGSLLIPAIDPVNPVPVADTLEIHCYFHFSSMDTDGDRCPNVKELGNDVALGGLRDYQYHWDFYDVWTRPAGNPTGWERNRVIDLFGDIFGVAYRFGAERPGGPPSKTEALSEAATAPAPADETGYHAEYDRSPPAPGADYWEMGPPDGTLDLFTDIFGVALQFGHDCTPFA